MTELKRRGGVRLGNASATWPFGTLSVTAERLEVSGGIIGTYVFTPGEVTAIEPAGLLRGGGICIVHTVDSYSERVRFNAGRNTKRLIAEIEATGFLNTPPPLPANRARDRVRDRALLERRAQGPLPFRVRFLVLAGVGWNVLLLPVLLRWVGIVGEDVAPEEAFAVWSQGRYAVIFMAALCLGVLFVEPFREWALKAGRTVAEVRTGVLFMLAILSVFLIVMIGGSAVG